MKERDGEREAERRCGRGKQREEGKKKEIETESPNRDKLD